MGAFHAYDIRGVYNEDFDKQIVYKVGFFLPELLGTNEILVGRDVRSSSPEIREYLIKGITDAGADVCDLGLSTTPMVYYATGKYGFRASVQITASHNPKEYNGLKVSGENALPVGFDTGLGKLKEWVETRAVIPLERRGTVKMLDVREEYLNFLSHYKKDISNLRVGMDLSNGMAGIIIKDVYGPSSPSINYIFEEPDGTFPNHEANPLVPENIRDLQNLVKEKRCDVGVIFDGDGDRVMFVDENGEFISPDLVIALMGHYFLEEKGMKGRVLQDIRSSKSVSEYLTPMGAEVHTWRVGRAYAAHKLREIDGIYGGELAGHYYFRDFFYSDSGILASLIVLGIISDMKRKGVSLSGVIDRISNYHNSGEINFRIENKSEAMKLLKDHFTSLEKPLALMDFDGYRVEFADWWFNVRPSNTEPYLRFIAEASSAGLLKEKVDIVKSLLK